MPIETRWSFHSGSEEVAKALHKLDDAVRKDISLKAMEAATSILVSPMKSAAPRDEGVLTKSINRAVRVYESKTFGIVGPQKDAWYGRLVEFGTKDRATKGKGKYKVPANRGRIRPTHFISRTGSAYSSRAASTIISVLTTEIARHTGG